MKKIFFIFILLPLLSSISAIRINEIEMNPKGIDSGNEWIELYSEDEIDIKDYKLINNDGNELALSGSFSGYYVYTFEKQWLDNIDEKIFLYKNDDLIDETNLFEDDKNNELTWQLCDSWEFLESTKGEENYCERKENEKKDEEVVEENEEIFEKVEKNNTQNIKLGTIELNTKDIKTGNDKKDLDKSDYAKYGFVIFCILLGLLFVFRKKRLNKNEFNE